MRIRKDRIKEGLAKASLDEYKGVIKDTKGAKFTHMDNKDVNDTLMGIYTDTKTNNIGTTKKQENMAAVNTSINEILSANPKKTVVNVKVTGIDNEKDREDIELAVKYIAQLTQELPLKYITIISGKYSGLTSSLFSKTVGKGVDIAPYQGTLMQHGEVKIDSIYFDKTGDKQLVYLNSAKKFTGIRNWCFNETVYALVGLMNVRQIDFSGRAEKVINSTRTVDNVSSWKDSINKTIVKILGDEEINTCLESIKTGLSKVPPGEANSLIEGGLNAVLMEYNAHCIISEIRPEALDDIIYKCTDDSVGVALKKYMDTGEITTIPIEHKASARKQYETDAVAFMWYALQKYACGTPIEGLGYNETITKLLYILVSDIQKLNSGGKIDLINFAIILEYLNRFAESKRLNIATQEETSNDEKVENN